VEIIWTEYMRYRARLRDFDLAGRNILCNILQNDTMAL